MKIRKQAVAVAVTVAMGMMAGSVMAASGDVNLYGAELGEVTNVIASEKGVTTELGSATNTGADFKVTGGEDWYEIFGGYSSASDNAFQNFVTVNGGTVRGNIYGGYVKVSTGGSANFNTVSISKSVTEPTTTPTIDAVVGNIDIVGGYTASIVTGEENIKSVSNNKVVIDGGAFTQYLANGKCIDIYGGRAYYYQAFPKPVNASNADASGNSVLISRMADGSSVRNVYGGYTGKGSAGTTDGTGNSVSFSGGTIKGNIYGGYVEHTTGGSANYNTVSISNSGTSENPIIPSIDATNGKIEIVGGYTSSAADNPQERKSASSNDVIIDGGEFTGDEAINVYGGRAHTEPQDVSTADANNNTVEIKQITGSLTYLYGGQADYGKVNGNTVTISAGSIDEVYGGGTSKGEEANNNTVTVNGGTINYVVGGFSEAGDANSNTVILCDGEVGVVTAGYGDDETSNNVVIWKKGTVEAGVSGGSSEGTSNTLVVYDADSKKSTEQNGYVAGFQNYLFVLNNTTNTTAPILSTDNVNNLAAGTKFGITIDKTNTPALIVGNKVTLISSANAMPDLTATTIANSVDYILNDASYGLATVNKNAYNAIKDTAAEGSVNKYEFSISQTSDKKSIVAEVTKAAPTVVITDVRQISDSSYVNFRSQMSDVTHRMGELRSSNSEGAWARLYGGKYTLGTGMKEKSITLQIGADRWFDANSYVGLTAAYTKADDTLTSGDNKQKNWNVGFYCGYVADSGLFVDAIVKHGQIKNDFSLRYESGEPSTGKYHTYGTSASIEGGWRFNCPTTAHYLEPQVELAYGHLQSVTFNAGNVEFQHDVVNSLVGRIGVAAGYKFAEDQGNLYLRTSLLHDFKGEVKTRATSGAETDGGSTRDLGGTWGEFVLGGNYKATKNLNFYGEMMCSTKNVGVRTKWQGSVGVRWAF